LTRDPLDDLGFDAQPPGLGQLLSDLASPPLDSELAGQRAALAMFRAVRAEQAAEPAPAPAAQPRVIRPATGKLPRRLIPARKAQIGARLVAAAMFLALAGGFAAAGYAAALPAPLQRVAHQVLGFAGVPDSPSRQPGLTHTPPVTSRAVAHDSPASSPSPSAPTSTAPTPKPSHHRSPGPRHSPKTPPSRSPSPHPSSPPADPVQITIEVAQQEITAGQSVEITASLTRSGPAAGVKLRLLERAVGRTGDPGGRGWQVVATADAHDQVTFTAPDLTTNAVFRVTGPGGAVSNRIGVAVVPPVTATLESGPSPKIDLLVASSPLAQRGDVVELEANVRGRWRVVRLKRLHQNGQTKFNVPLRKISVTYRVVIPATKAHAMSVSSQVTAPARIKHAIKVQG
jgi:hypothetical protein